MGGFQVYSDPVTIPFGPLTLLYGPNSAGKSAILDAMLAMAGLCELWAPANPSFASDRKSVNSILGRHWRREGVMQAALVEALLLGAVIRIGGSEWAMAGFAKKNFGFEPIATQPLYPRFSEPLSCLQPLVKAKEVDVAVSFQYVLSEQGQPSEGFAIGNLLEISLGDAPILRYSQPGQWASINLNHAALLAWNTGVDLKWIAPRSEQVCEYIDGWFTMSHSCLNYSGLTTNAGDQMELIPRESLTAEENVRVRSAETSFINMFDALFLASLKSVGDALRVPVVPASRVVPRSSELTYILDAQANPLPGEPLGLLMNGLPKHQSITREAFIIEMERCGLRKPPEGFLGGRLPRSEKNPLDLVNRLLGDYLFRTSGYFVAANVHELTLLGGLEGLRQNPKNVDRKFLVSLELRDAAGRHFNFDEVGSGLGYVLPVLLAIATSDVTFLQQPELHLHPALQSELADALIVALSDAAFGGISAEGCRQIIAETHSEHLLLRLLRRVRQAADPDRSIDPHSFGREDLVVLYVDPKPDGTSTVKHLRIAKDGEFIDRWPRGFFEERGKELFDE